MSLFDPHRTERLDIHRAVLRLECILSPARYVSENIWREIFPHCCSEPTRPGLSFSVAPLLLTHVRRGWKSISIKTHSSGAGFISTSQLIKCLYRVIKALEKGLIGKGQCSLIGWIRSPSVIHWAERDSGFTCRSPIIELHFSSHPPRGTFSPSSL